MTLLIATGADAGYFPLVRELIASIDDVLDPGRATIGVIDAGLTPEQAAWMRGRGILVATPPVPPAAAGAVKKRPALAVNLGKPWLDVCFPGFETLIWMDGDTWLQDAAAIDGLSEAASHGALAIVPGAGRYVQHQIYMRWWVRGLGENRGFLFKNARNARLPLRICRDIGTRAELNAGVFALRADAPHWERMRSWQGRILRHGKPFTSDQLAIGLVAYVDRLPVELMPEGYNYIEPFRIDPGTGTLLEYYYPYRKVGIVHMAAKKAVREDPSVTIPMLGTDGVTYHLNLRYGRPQAVVQGPGRERNPAETTTAAV